MGVEKVRGTLPPLHLDVRFISINSFPRIPISQLPIELDFMQEYVHLVLGH